MLPFTREEFLGFFSDYDAAVWPAQPTAYLLGAAALLALVRPGEGWQRFALATLAVMWLWTGIAYHWLFFVEINPAAVAFAVIFVVQGLAFAHRFRSIRTASSRRSGTSPAPRQRRPEKRRTGFRSSPEETAAGGNGRTEDSGRASVTVSSLLPLQGRIRPDKYIRLVQSGPSTLTLHHGAEVATRRVDLRRISS